MIFSRGKFVCTVRHVLLSNASACKQCASISRRAEIRQNLATEHISDGENVNNWQRRIFSGIQPTGDLHLGNYLGAVRKWVELQERKEDIMICIVDMHSITMPQNPPVLSGNIINMAATLLACGIDPAKTTLFVQSSVPEHCELSWILNCMTTMQRLAHLPQYKEKSQALRELPLGLYLYPILQAADIMLYKATHVPVGADQIQHIQLVQHLISVFNNRFGEMFPICEPMIENTLSERVRSLREPTKKMSKSDLKPKATVFLRDEPEVIVSKIKKAVTDHTSDVSYDPETRPGVSNLISIYSMITGQSINEVISEAVSIDTGVFKLRVAEALVEHLRPIREDSNLHLARREALIYMLEESGKKARLIANKTLTDVKQRLGLGTSSNIPMAVQMEPKHEAAAIFKKANMALMSKSSKSEVFVDNNTIFKPIKLKSYKPNVPQQRLRIEKPVQPKTSMVELQGSSQALEKQKPLKLDTINEQTKGRVEQVMEKITNEEKNTTAPTENTNADESLNKIEIST